jgi:hypothetical protein
MSNTSVITIAIAVNGDGLSDNYAPTANLPIINPGAPGSVPTAVALSSGSNTVNFPVGTKTVLIFPPAGSVITKSVGGLNIHPAGVFLYSPPVGTTSMVIVAGSGETIAVAFA